MPDPSRMLDIAPGEYAKAYQKLAKDHGVSVSPLILGALNKLDANKDPSKTKGLKDAVVAAIVKWDATWNEQLKDVADQKVRDLRAAFAVEMFKYKQSLHLDAPPAPGKSDKTDGKTDNKTDKTDKTVKPEKPGPYKKTTFCVELSKLRARTPVGSAYALANLDEAKTLEEAKPLAVAAQKELEQEIAKVDAVVKSTKDKDYQLKASAYASSLRSMLRRVKEVAT